MKTTFDNRMAWDGSAGHYEVWYVTLNHRPSGSGFWIRYTLEAPHAGAGAPYAQLWFCRGDRQRPERTFGINRRVPIGTLEAQAQPFSLRLGGAGAGGRLWDEGLSGELAGDGHRARWQLRFAPAPRVPVHRHLPAFAYAGGGRLPSTVVVSPNLSIALRGTIEVDGESYELEGEPGGQSHLWGRKHAYAWAWAHCNAFDTGTGHETAVLEALSVQLRRGPLLLPRLTMLSVYPEGAGGPEVACKELRCLPWNRSEYHTGYYHLLGTNERYRVEATLGCRAEDAVMAEYVDPDGDPAYCHNTVVGNCELIIHRRSAPWASWQEWRRLGSRGGAHFEWGGRAGDPLVRKRHVSVGP